MAEHAILFEHLQHVPTLIGGVFALLADADGPLNPLGGGSPFTQQQHETPVGAIIVGFLIGIGISVLFGFWGKSRAEQHNVHPAIGFALGFVLGWIGVALVPVFKKDRVFNSTTTPRYQQQTQSMPNPMYSASAYQPPPAGPQQYQPQPQYPPQNPPQPQYPMPPAQGMAPPPQPQMLQADAQGYVGCPGCGARTKAGRKTCMSCGGAMPPVYNPNVR